MVSLKIMTTGAGEPLATLESPLWLLAASNTSSAK